MREVTAKKLLFAVPAVGSLLMGLYWLQNAETGEPPWRGVVWLAFALGWVVLLLFRSGPDSGS